MFTITNELNGKERDKIENNVPVECYELVLHHKTKYYPTFLFSNIESAKRFAENHAAGNSRLKVNYGIAKGTLKGNYFTTNCYNMIKGRKEGKLITW